MTLHEIQSASTAPAVSPQPPWWRTAAIYQVYIRSFADGDGDGIGDIAGARARLPYLSDLGIDAIWINPWYRSPMADAGYDVASYREIDPLFGDLSQAERLIEEAHALGIRVILDVVPNHCSDAADWFQAALASPPGSAERRRFWFRPGRGTDGSEPPNDWRSNFGGSAWTRVPDGEWYLHSFTAEQPDFNWQNPEVRSEFEAVIRFWLDRGVDGFRIDVAHGLVKDEGLPDVGPDPDPRDLPYVDQPEVHEIWREWRRIVDEYDGARVLVGEVWVESAESFARYLRPDELHTAFNFDFLRCPWGAKPMRAVIDETLAAHAPVGAPATWVLANHDVTRHVTRYGRADTSFDFATRQFDVDTDLALGTRRARAAALLTMALPGSVYVYQGDELGLWEVEDIPDGLREDPVWHRSGYTERGRDGCRVPLPWNGTEPPFGFSPAGARQRPWLPQPSDWSTMTAAAQAAEPESMLNLYRAALRVRRAEDALRTEPLAWLPSVTGVLAFTRGAQFACVLNAGEAAVALPAHDAILLASGTLRDGALPPDTAAWLRMP
jgi:alpha-glucosidase